MMLSFLKTLIFVLTLRLIVVKSAKIFCREFPSVPENRRTDPTVMMFIPTANDQYVYLDTWYSQTAYKFNTICKYGDKCPNFGVGIPLTQFTDNKLKKLSHKRNPFIYNRITYLYGDLVDNDTQKVGIKMYANGTTDWIYKTNEWLDKSIKSYAICYLWKTDRIKEPGLIPNSNINKPSELIRKDILSIFVPPYEPYLPIGSIPRYGFSFDKTEVNDITVEVTGNYPNVDFVYDAKPYLYTFGDFIVPCIYKQYLLLPNGDAIATVDIRDKETDKPKYVIFYFRSDPTDFLTIFPINLTVLFGCDNKQIPPKNLSDYKTDNIYSYFNKN